MHPTSKKRSELTAALLKESIALELREGRKEVKIRVEKPPLFVENFSKEGSFTKLLAVVTALGLGREKPLRANERLFDPAAVQIYGKIGKASFATIWLSRAWVNKYYC